MLISFDEYELTLLYNFFSFSLFLSSFPSFLPPSRENWACAICRWKGNKGKRKGEKGKRKGEEKEFKEVSFIQPQW
jgi:hypothetical protein